MESKFGFEGLNTGNIRIELLNVLKDRKSKNKQYSLRALARDLKVSHSFLSQVMNGHRKISITLYRKMIEDLRMDVSKDFTNMNTYTIQNEETILMTNRWYFNVLIDLPLLESYQPGTQWAARVLDTSEETIEAALKILEKQKLIKRFKNGRWKPQVMNTSTLGQTQTKSVEAIKQLQMDFLKKQMQALMSVPVEECSQVGITMAIDPEDLPKAREKIYTFVRDLSEYLERNTGKPKKEIYRLSLSLFPLTRVSRKPKS